MGIIFLKHLSKMYLLLKDHILGLLFRRKILIGYSQELRHIQEFLHVKR